MPDDVKLCPRCNLRPCTPRKPDDKRKRKFQPLCPVCNREYQREHYRLNKADYIRKAQANKEKLRNIIRDIKESTPCADCGKSYPYFQMDFDHLDGKTKKFGISRGVDTGSVAVILAEIAKCQVVCTLCHRLRTHQRMHPLTSP